jgi:pyruvate/2-oxoglutarate dehydrogenase complex dihydrolipoamide dehydrogenase (E3) component
VIEQASALLGREEPEAAEAVRTALQDEGIRFELGACCFGLERPQTGDGIVVTYERHGQPQRVPGSHVLVAAGRTPNTEDLGLEQAGIERDARGYIPVDDTLRTRVSGVWALGDVNGRGAFTHTSWNDHEVVAANVLEGQQRSISGRVPRYALYVDPPLARIGDSERQARERGGRVLVGSLEMKHVARARERSETRGLMKVLVDAASMKLLGATIVGIDGDEVIHSLIDLMAADVDVRTIAASVPIHPTISELIPTMLQRLQPLS